MSLEAIDMVMKAEQDGVSLPRRGGAGSEKPDAERGAGRAGDAEPSPGRDGDPAKELLQQAETRAAQAGGKRSTRKRRRAPGSSQTEAQARLALAADEIVGRIVK